MSVEDVGLVERARRRASAQERGLEGHFADAARTCHGRRFSGSKEEKEVVWLGIRACRHGVGGAYTPRGARREGRTKSKEIKTRTYSM